MAPKLALYLCEMLHHHRDSLTQEDQAAVSDLLVSSKYSAPSGTIREVTSLGSAVSIAMYQTSFQHDWHIKHAQGLANGSLMSV